MKVKATDLIAVLIAGGLVLVVLATARGGEDWLELVVIGVATVVLAVAAGRRSATPRRRVRGFTRTPDSDW